MHIYCHHMYVHEAFCGKKLVVIICQTSKLRVNKTFVLVICNRLLLLTEKEQHINFQKISVPVTLQC